MLLRSLFLALLLATTTPDGGVDLGGGLGFARASARQLSASTVELDLELTADPDSTPVAHLIEPGSDQRTVPLVELSPGLFGVLLEVRKVNFVVVFEVIQPGLSRQSQPLLLTDLGVAPAVLGIIENPGTEVEEPTSSAELWGWAGLGLGALALLGLAIWAWPDRKEPEPERENSG